MSSATLRTLLRACWKRQQAHALIEARATTVNRATDVAKTAIANSAEILSADDRSKFLVNLLVVLVSDYSVAAPVIPL